MDTLILGAGPCGLGAATRLKQRGETSWLVVDKADGPGGLSSSFTTKEGFVVDRGGHVIFSFFKYFDDLIQKSIGSCYDNEQYWATHVRKSYVMTREEDEAKVYKVPYPFQHNIGGLSTKTMEKCLQGILHRDQSRDPENFLEWIKYNFGEGIASSFMIPYNEKVWAHKLETMSKDWIANRVAKVDAYSVVKNVLEYTPNEKWGPNKVFHFPQRGGTGAIYEGVAKLLPLSKQRYGETVVKIDKKKKEVHLTKLEQDHDGDGSRPKSTNSIIKYKNLISTIPLDVLMDMVGLQPDFSILRHSSTHVVFFGFEGTNPNSKESCWSYFPDRDVPFYRATVLSNYGKYNVPNPSKHFSLMLEVSESSCSPLKLSNEDLVVTCLKACVKMGLVTKNSRVVSTYHEKFEYGYPTPTLGLEEYVYKVLSKLKESGIYSRGRFGAYLYQVSNQDHSVMQGVQAVDNLFMGTPETVLHCPDYINSMYNTDYVFGRQFVNS